MRALVPVALFLVGLLVAGCISETPVFVPDPDEVPEGFERTVRFDAAGGPLPVTGAAGRPWHATSGHNGAEPNMGITSQGTVFMTAMSNMLRSTDMGENWEIVHTHQFMNSDPMMWVDPWTDQIYNAPMFPILLCASIYKSKDDGATWDAVPYPNCGRNIYDHQKLASGPPGPDAPPLAGVLHPTVLVMCYNAIVATYCAVSYDDGVTWPHDIPASVNGPLGLPGATPATTGCISGQNGHPTFAPNGVITFAKTWGCAQPYLVYSLDSGVSWKTVAGPQGKGAATLDPEIAFTPDGTLYYLYQGADHLAYLARTRDLGQSWDGPWQVSPAGVTSTAFAALGTGDDGRIAMTFLGTDHPDASNPSNAPDDARWHLWMVTSDDADGDAPTFTAYRSTPDDEPVQIGCVWLGGGSTPCRNMLDFIDGAVHPDGTWFTAYTTGCHTDCAGNANATNQESRARATSIARLDGWSLYVDAAPMAMEEAIDRR